VPVIWPASEGDEIGWPVTWDDCQDFVERPRMRGESETEHAGRAALAKLSRQIRTRLLNPWRCEP
jgi:hypothetical protein